MGASFVTQSKLEQLKVLSVKSNKNTRKLVGNCVSKPNYIDKQTQLSLRSASVWLIIKDMFCTYGLRASKRGLRGASLRGDLDLGLGLGWVSFVQHVC